MSELPRGWLPQIAWDESPAAHVAVVRPICKAGSMVKGTLLAESLKIGAELDVAGLRLTRVSRRDVSASVSPPSHPPGRSWNSRPMMTLPGRWPTPSPGPAGRWRLVRRFRNRYGTCGRVRGQDLPLSSRRPRRPRRGHGLRQGNGRTGTPAGLAGLTPSPIRMHGPRHPDECASLRSAGRSGPDVLLQ